MWPRAGIVAAMIVVLCGCGSDGPTRIPVSGSVTRGGKPIERGSLTFRPAAGQKGLAANEVIQNGKYRFTRETGPSPGAYQVLVQEAPSKEEAMKNSGEGTPSVAHWEKEVTVPANGSTILDISVDPK